MTSRGIVLATRSEGKLRELHPLFAAAGFEVTDLRALRISETPDEELLERHETFEENALAKARHFHVVTGGKPTVADDSGLLVAALGDVPGVRSKRWSGRSDLSGQALDEANNALLLQRLGHSEDRRARYVCVAAYVDDRTELLARGETHGHIALAPRGTNGFGYDPFFHSDELGVTFGQATVEAKERVSHRGRAVRALLAQLRSR